MPLLHQAALLVMFTLVLGGAVVDKLHDLRQDWCTLFCTHPEKENGLLLLWSTRTGVPSLTPAQALLKLGSCDVTNVFFLCKM